MENKYLKSIFLVIFITLLVSCMEVINPKERNKIVFHDDIEAVKDSINAMNELLIKIDYDFFTYAVTDKNSLYINYKNGDMYYVGKISDKFLSLNDKLYFLCKEDKYRFINLIIFLNKNYINRCDKYKNQMIYLYRDNIYMADFQSDLDRFIVLVESRMDINFHQYKILDNHRNLYLLAYKDAKIWVGKKK